MRPFYSGTQYQDWMYQNCKKCKKFNEDDITKSCVLDQALGDALFGNGEISDEVAERIGIKTGEVRYIWDCLEKEC